MAKPKVIVIKTLQKYTERIQSLQRNAIGPIWCRGIGDFGSHILQPSFYRHPKKKLPKDLANLESQLMQRFLQRSKPFDVPILNGEWEPLFYMQHYGIPTRLLDWSESPLVAFYFAVMSAHRNGSGLYSDVGVWILDPIVWNRHALKDIRYSEGILSADSEGLKGYTFRKDYEGMKEYPVAMYGTHNSRRIVAQRGVFTIFGQSKEPMEVAFEKGKFPPNCLYKVKLPSKSIPQLRKAIIDIGITESVVFPDLEGFASEMKRYFEFGV